jgi:hypothetical protein
METKKLGHYKNGVEKLSGDFKIAKQMLIDMAKFKGKLGDYGPLSKLKTLPKHTEIDRFISNDFEFIVINYESMNFSFNTMTVSKPELATAVYWQKIK